MADSDVQVKFGASINGLLDGVAESKEAIDGLSSYLSDLGDSFKEVAETIGVAFAIDKIAEFDSEFAELGEHIERASKILGESGENIQLFSLAMKMAGGDADSAGMTLNILQKNIGDAISKAGPARTAFENMGFSLEKLKSTDVVTLLFQIKERMDEAGSSAEQSALKQDYLRTVAGRQAAQFLALGMTLDDVRKLAEKTGYVMSDQMTKDASDLSGATKTLDAAWKGLSNTVSDKVSPAYKGFIGYMTELIEKTNELISANDHLSTQDKPYDPTGMLKSFDKTGAQSNSASNVEPWQRFGPQGMPLGKGQFGPPVQPAAKPLPPLDIEKDTSKSDDNAENEHQQAVIALQKLAYDQQVQYYDSLAALGKITEAQKIADLTAAANQQYTLDQQALDNALLTDQQYIDKSNILYQQHELELAKLNEQAAQAQRAAVKQEAESFQQLFSPMERAMDGALQGILQGTQTVTQAMGRLFGDMVSSILEDIAKIALHWAAMEASTAAFGASDSMTKALGASVPSTLGGTQQNSVLNAAMTKLGTLLGLNTAAHTTGTAATTTNTVATTVDTSTTAGSTVATTAGTLATTANTTSTVSSGLLHMAAMAENTVATVANTLSTDLLKLAMMIKSFLPSFDVGSYSVPSDMVAQIHAGEMIIPAAQAAQIRSGAAGIGGGSVTAGGGAGGAISMNISLSALDTQSGMQFLNQNAVNLGNIIAKQIRNGHSGLVNAVKA